MKRAPTMSDAETPNPYLIPEDITDGNYDEAYERGVGAGIAWAKTQAGRASTTPPNREALVKVIDENTDQVRLTDYGDVAFTSDIYELADAVLTLLASTGSTDD